MPGRGALHPRPRALTFTPWRLVSAVRHRFEAFLSVPLLSRGRLVGVINLQHRDPHRYGDRQIRLIAAMGLLRENRQRRKSMREVLEVTLLNDENRHRPQ
jgi:GAF domain-containing protein